MLCCVFLWVGYVSPSQVIHEAVVVLSGITLGLEIGIVLFHRSAFRRINKVLRSCDIWDFWKDLRAEPHGHEVSPIPYRLSLKPYKVPYGSV